MEKMEILDTLGFLLGTWSITRSLDDHYGGVKSSFVGHGVFAAPPTSGHWSGARRARYEEYGELRFADYTGEARRNLDYVSEEAATVLAFFDDGRPFVDLDLRAGSWQAHHLCGDDHYEMATHVVSWDVVEERWRVRGPATCYDAVTTLARVH